MFITYLGRELRNRRRQTVIIAIGMALAIALVILVNAVSGGVKNAQATALQSVYGVGTDITVSKTATTAGTGAAGRQNFRFGSGAGRTNGQTRTFGTARLTTGPDVSSLAGAAVTTTRGTTGVKAATGVLTLTNIAFSGSTPTGTTGRGQGGAPGQAPTGGPGGNGGSAFGVTATTVLGYDVTRPAIGPLTAATLTTGRTLTSADAGKRVALLDSDYATSAKKKVGGTVSLGGKSFSVVGIVKSTSTSGSSASNVYVPLDTAQTVADLKNKVTSVYVEAASASAIPSVQSALKSSLGSSVTVNTQSDLASNVTGSLATASTLATGLGLWLSILVLAAAFLIAVLFTIAGVTRRTREFGTLKAIGWSDRRIVGQVAGESFVQGLIGGVLGIVLGVVAILVVNAIHPTLTAAASTRAFAGGGGAGGGFGGGQGGGFGRAAAAANDAASAIGLTLPVTASVILLAVALAVIGGLIAGAFGGWRAARLRPAAALRSVE